MISRQKSQNVYKLLWLKAYIFTNLYMITMWLYLLGFSEIACYLLLCSLHIIICFAMCVLCVFCLYAYVCKLAAHIDSLFLLLSTSFFMQSFSPCLVFNNMTILSCQETPDNFLSLFWTLRVLRTWDLVWLLRIQKQVLIHVWQTLSNFTHWEQNAIEIMHWLLKCIKYFYSPILVISAVLL